MLDQVTSDWTDKRDEIVALTRELVRIPTINPPGDAYAPAPSWSASGCGGAASPSPISAPRARPATAIACRAVNVIARRESGRPGPCVHFNGHIDVVPAGQGWTVDPWAGEVRDGRVYGRGTCDMKGGLAAAIVAVETLLESGLELPGALEISGTVDEESGGYGGVA